MPYALAIGVGMAIGGYRMKDIATQEVLSGAGAGYWDLTLYWRLAQTATALTLLQMGYFYQNADVEKVTQPGGAEFLTTGSMRERGVFIGIAYSIYLAAFLASSVAVRKNATGLANGNQPTLNTALSLGYGNQEFSAFGGGFTQDQDDLFGVPNWVSTYR